MPSVFTIIVVLERGEWRHTTPTLELADAYAARWRKRGAMVQVIEDTFNMATFTDASGRQWSLVIDMAQIRRIGKELGVRLDKLFDDSMKPLGALLQDLEKFIGVIWCLIEEDAQHGPSPVFRWWKPWTWLLRGLSPEDFGRSLDGEALQRAEAAFWEALTDFFPNQKNRLNRFRAKILDLLKQEEAKEASRLEALTLEQALAQTNGQLSPAGKS